MVYLGMKKSIRDPWNAIACKKVTVWFVTLRQVTHQSYYSVSEVIFTEHKQIRDYFFKLNIRVEIFATEYFFGKWGWRLEGHREVGKWTQVTAKTSGLSVSPLFLKTLDRLVDFYIRGRLWRKRLSKGPQSVALRGVIAGTFMHKDYAAKTLFDIESAFSSQRPEAGLSQTSNTSFKVSFVAEL